MKKDLNKYWLEVNRHHRNLKWMSYDDWDENTKKDIDEAIKSVKKVLDKLTETIEKNKKSLYTL